MKTKLLTIGIILLFVVVAMTPCINSNVVISSYNIQENKISQKDMLFQTIIDIANNKELQGIILKSQLSKSGFFHPDVKFPILKTPLITKNQLKQIFFIGLILSKTISKSKMHSLLEQHQMISQVLEKELNDVIEKNVTLKTEITWLSIFKCDCEDSSTVTIWQFPIICAILGGIGVFSVFLILTIGLGYTLYVTVNLLGEILNCPWTPLND